MWPCLDLWGPCLTATKTACSWDMYMISEQRPTTWDDLGSERLDFPKAPHLHPYSVSHVSLLPLMPQVFAQPATPSARVASSQTPLPPFSGQNPTGDARLYPGLPRFKKSTDGPRNLHRPRYGKRGDEDKGGLVGGGASAWSSWTS